VPPQKEDGWRCDAAVPPNTLGTKAFGMSKTTWVLFSLAMVCYLASWSHAAIAMALVGVLFELFMYISMYGDSKRKNRHK
jgi:hypothetical protein